MKVETLSEAFNLLDDDIIEAVDLVRKNSVPVKNKNTWKKWVAMVACFCVIITTFIFSRGLFRGSDGATEDMVSYDDMVENISQPMITIPEYTFLKGNEDISKYYDLKRDDQDATSDAQTESGLSEQQFLPVFQDMSLESAVIFVENVEELEIQLSKITVYKKSGQYPVINSKEAIEYLNSGKYISFVDSETKLDMEKEPTLVYLYDKNADIAIPFYYFQYTETVNSESITNGVYVPAISEEFITNMPGPAVEE